MTGALPVKVIFCTYPSVYSDIVLASLLRAKHIDVVGIVESTRVLRKRGIPFWDTVLFLKKTGWQYSLYSLIATSFYRLCVPLPLKRGVQAQIKRRVIPILRTRDINLPPAKQFITAHSPAIVLSAHFNQLIGQSVLALEGVRFINIHPALLPDYQGVDPVFYASLNAEPVLGVSVHYQEAEFDSGNILASHTMQRTENESVLQLNQRLFQLGVELFLQQVERYRANLPSGNPQQQGGRYDSWPTVAHIRHFRLGGGRLWHWRDYTRLL